MLSHRQIWVSGILATAFYLICTALAYFNYPLAYSPLANWLSDLGNPLANPNGAFWYNLGVVLTGVCLTFFFLGMEIWNDGDKRRRIVLRITQAMGIISSLALIVSALFPLGAQTLMHEISGKAHIFFVGFFLAFSASLFFRLPRMPKWIPIFGILAAVINFIYGVFLFSVYIAEWAAIGAFIVYVLIISGYALKQDAPQAVTGHGEQVQGLK